MLRPFDSVNTKRVIDHSENEETPELTSKESPSDNHNKPILSNKQDLLKKKNSNNNPILTNKHDTNKIFNKPLTPLKRSGSANSILFDTPTNKRLDSKYREIESGYQHEEELEYIPEEAIPFDINDFGDSIHMEAYEEDLDIKHPELITDDEFSLIKSQRQFQMEKEINSTQNILQDEDVIKKPISKFELEKAIEESISMPELREKIIIEYPNDIEYCPPHEEESEYSSEDITSIDFNDFDDTLVFEAYEGSSSSDSEVSESLYEIESSSYKKSKRQYQLETLDQQLEQLKKEDVQFLRDEDVYKTPITKQSLIKAIEDSITFPDMNHILSIEPSIDIDEEISFDEVYQFVV